MIIYYYCIPRVAVKLPQHVDRLKITTAVSVHERVLYVHVPGERLTWREAECPL